MPDIAQRNAEAMREQFYGATPNLEA